LKAPDSLVGNWDRNRLDQVVTNLVANAIKYAGGKPIDIEIASRGGSAFVSVRDRGPGISVADQERIFQQFERAVPPAIAGLGLGLWIASRIVEAHGGSIKVESRPGEGASFIVELALLPPS
jgi:signal transduction histidine kinase